MKSHKEELLHKIDQFNTIHAYKPTNPVILKFVSGIKPTNYFAPDIWIGSGLPKDRDIHTSWYVEIYANGKCIFRESATNEDEINLHEFEEMLCSRILLNSFIGSIFQQMQIHDL